MATLSNITNAKKKNLAPWEVGMQAGQKNQAGQVYTAPNTVQKPVDLSKPTQNLSVTGTSATSGGNKFILPQNVAPKAPLPAKEAPVDPYSTPEYLQALADKQNKIAQEALVEKGMQDTNKVASTYGLATGPSTIEEAVKAFKDKQAAQKSDLQKQIDEANRVDRLQAGQSNAQAEAAQSANTATFAQGREGAMSGTAPKLVSEFNTATQKRVNDTNTRLDYAISQREKLMTDLDEAQKSGQQELAASIEKQLSLAQLQIDKVQTDLANATANASKESADYIKQLTSVSEGMSASFASQIAQMDIPTIQTTYGFDVATANIFKTSSLMKSSIDPSDPEYRKKMAEADKAESDALFAQMTPEQKNFEYYKNMLTFDPEGANQFAQSVGLTEKSFFGDYQQEYSGMVANRNITLNETGAILPLKSRYKFQVTKDGAVSFADSAPNGTVLQTRGQCGEFVNDCLNGGPGLFGDTFAQKKSRVNSILPIAGGAFVEDVGDSTGHVGMIEKVYNDGSFDIRESNYVASNTISVAHITPGSNRYKSILRGGFYAPEGTSAVAKSGSDSLSSNPTFQKYAQALADKTITLSGLKDLGMSQSDIGALMTASLDYVPKEKRDDVDIDFAKEAASTIFSGTSSLNIDDFSKGSVEQKLAIEGELEKLRKEALASGDFTGVMKASAGGKAPSETFKTQFSKSVNVISQVGELANLFSTEDTKKAKEYAKNQGVDTAPFTAWFKKKNLWDSDSQAISASLNGIIPNLARGVFGEVGVLTDQDIEQYKKVVPNLSQPETTRKVVSALLMKNLQKSIENNVQTEAVFGGDVSGAVPLYEKIQQKIDAINKELGITEDTLGGEKFSYQIPEDKNSDIDFDF